MVTVQGLMSSVAGTALDEGTKGSTGGGRDGRRRQMQRHACLPETDGWMVQSRKAIPKGIPCREKNTSRKAPEILSEDTEAIGSR